MLVDQQAGRLARSDKVLMCGDIKGWTTDCILEAYFRGATRTPLVLFLVVNFLGPFLLPWIAFLLTALCIGVKRPMYGGEYLAD